MTAWLDLLLGIFSAERAREPIKEPACFLVSAFAHVFAMLRNKVSVKLAP